MIPADSPKVEDAVWAALFNIQQFDAAGFAVWLQRQRASTQRLAQAFPPNRIYQLRDGLDRSAGLDVAPSQLSPRPSPLAVIVDYRDLGPGRDLGLMILGLGRAADATLGGLPEVGSYASPLEVDRAQLRDVTEALQTQYDRLTRRSSRR